MDNQQKHNYKITKFRKKIAIVEGLKTNYEDTNVEPFTSEKENIDIVKDDQESIS